VVDEVDKVVEGEVEGVWIGGEGVAVDGWRFVE
jgi:hypothetical protein